MSPIRYQNPVLANWPALDRWSNLRDEINTLFETPFRSAPTAQSQLYNGWTPALDLYQTNDDVIALVELPGMRKEDIELSLHDGMLTISGERIADAHYGEMTARSERFVGKFRRSISLPTRVDAGKVTATYKDGILTVTLPKAEEVKPKQIQVNVS